MSVPILSNVFALWAVFAVGAVIAVLLTVAVALLTRDSRPTRRHRAQVQPPLPTAEMSADEHVLV